MATIRLTPLLLAALATACTVDDRTAGIPSQESGTHATEYDAAVDSARILALEHVAARYLPGVTVAIGRKGEVVWAEAFGWSDLTYETPSTPETLYPVGSISKSLTATAAGLLYERGQLDFDFPIQVYLPDFPEKRWPITTRQLMGHVAGIQNYGAMEALRQQHCDDATSGIYAIAEDTVLWEPGTDYSYSNYGFRLVGAVVESAAGEPYLDFMHREVITAMGLERTIPDRGDAMGSGPATKYTPNDFRVVKRTQDVDMSCSMAAGGFLSTPSDLVRFGFAMLNAEILERETVELFWSPQRLADGEPTSYGMGWQMESVRLGDDDGSTRMIGHGGSVLGGRASLAIYPDEDMVVVTMTNTRGNVTSLGRQVAALFRDGALDGSD